MFTALNRPGESGGSSSNPTPENRGTITPEPPGRFRLLRRGWPAAVVVVGNSTHILCGCGSHSHKQPSGESERDRPLDDQAPVLVIGGRIVPFAVTPSYVVVVTTT